MVCSELPQGDNITRFGVVKMNSDGKITEFEEKAGQCPWDMVSTGIYVVRGRLLIELVEKAQEQNRFDFVKDILVQYRGL